MLLTLDQADLDLARDQLVRLRRRGALDVRCRRGTLWITVDHDPRDIVLGPGQQCRLDGGRAVLLQALGGSARVTLSEPGRARPAQPAAGTLNFATPAASACA